MSKKENLEKKVGILKKMLQEKDKKKALAVMLEEQKKNSDILDRDIINARKK